MALRTRIWVVASVGFSVSSPGFTGAHTGTTLGFYSVTPTTRPAAYTQTYSTAARDNPALTAVTLAGTGATNVTPYGFTTAAQANALVSSVNALVFTDIPAIQKLLNSVIDDLQALGLLQ